MIKELIVQIKVEEYGPELYRINDTGSLVRKSLCTVISYDTEQEEKEFVLPDKWCVFHCKESLAWIQKNAENNASNIRENIYYYMPCDESRNNTSTGFPKGYTEITQDQFFAHVWEKELKKEEPEAPVPVVQETTERTLFDLKLWDTGKYDVVQRDGNFAKVIDIDPSDGVKMVAKSTNGIKSYSNLNGIYLTIEQSDYDLFLVAKTETVWLNLYIGCGEYKSESQAKSGSLNANNGLDYFSSIEVKRPIK